MHAIRRRLTRFSLKFLCLLTAAAAIFMAGFRQGALHEQRKLEDNAKADFESVLRLLEPEEPVTITYPFSGPICFLELKETTESDPADSEAVDVGEDPFAVSAGDAWEAGDSDPFAVAPNETKETAKVDPFAAQPDGPVLIDRTYDGKIFSDSLTRVLENPDVIPGRTETLSVLRPGDSLAAPVDLEFEGIDRSSLGLE